MQMNFVIYVLIGAMLYLFIIDTLIVLPKVVQDWYNLLDWIKSRKK